MLIAFDANQTREYQLKGHTGPDDPKFTLGVMDSGLEAHLNDSGKSYERPRNVDDPAIVRLHTEVKDREVVRFGLKSVTNLKDAKGSIVELATQEISTPVGLRRGLTDASLDLVKPWLMELAEEIQSDNTVTEEEEKN